MRVSAFAVGLFAVAFLLHWLCWRIRRPRRALGALLLIFLGTLVIGLAAAPHLSWVSWLAPTGFWETFHVCLFHVALSLAYIVTYSALEQDSPTLTIIAYAAAAGDRGRSREDLLGLIQNDQIVGARCEALYRGGIITLSDTQGGTYFLTPKGRRWALVLDLFRRIYRLKKGG